MAIKLADTARPNNYVDAEHLGTYPVAYAEDVWFADGTRLSEKTFDGQSIQKEELPLASADEVGNIYQYIGTSGTYEHGYFYECVQTSTSPIRYGWVLTPEKPKTIIDVETIPDTDIKNVFYRTPNRGETQSINVDVHTELENQRFEIVRQRVIDAGFTVTKNQGDYFTYTMTYPTPLYVNTYSLQTGWLIPEGLQLEDATIGGVATPTIRIYWSDGTHNYSVSIRYHGDSPAVFEYADPTPSALWVGNEEEQTVTKLDDGQSFIGTQAEWDALSQSQKNKYDGKIVNIVEDGEASTKEIEELTNYTISQEALTVFPDLALRLHVYKYGKIIQVCCDNIAIGDRSLLGDYFKIVEGLPAPLYTINFTYPAFPDETIGKSTIVPAYIGTGGTIMLRHVGMISDSATYLQGFSVVYLTREA